CSRIRRSMLPPLAARRRVGLRRAARQLAEQLLVAPLRAALASVARRRAPGSGRGQALTQVLGYSLERAASKRAWVPAPAPASTPRILLQARAQMAWRLPAIRT